MGRLQQIERAFDDRGIEAESSAIEAIRGSLRGQVRGLSRTGAKRADGLLAVSPDGAVLWDAAGKTIHPIDLGAYSSVHRNNGVVRLTGDGVQAVTVRPADTGRSDRWLELFHYFGITEASSTSVNSLRARLAELTPRLQGTKVDRVVAALARELLPGESIDAALPAKRVPASRSGQGVVVATNDRLIHVEASSKHHHTETFTFAETLAVSSGFQPLLSTALITIARPDAIHQLAVGTGEVARRDANRFAVLANDRVPAESKMHARWWQRATLPRTNVGVLEYFGGHPVFPKGAGTLALKLSSTGVDATGAFGAHFSIPWSEVTGFSVEPSDLAPRRIPTMSRFLAIGVSAFVLKHKAYEQSHLVLETDEGEMIFAIAQTAQKVRSRLAPYIGAFAGTPQRAMGVTYRTGEARKTSRSGDPVDPVEVIRRLATLRDAGALTTTEFNAKKRELLKRI